MGYTNLVRTFQAFPHWPNLVNVLRDVGFDEQGSVVKVIADGGKTPAQRRGMGGLIVLRLFMGI